MYQVFIMVAIVYLYLMARWCNSPSKNVIIHLHDDKCQT